jgi:nucleotide-binding universal stress UspA family protein
MFHQHRMEIDMSQPASVTPGRIVAGVDGSPSSVEALRWAARQAELTGAQLEAVTTWHFPANYGGYPIDGDWQANAEAVLETAIQEALGELPSGLSRQVLAGHPVPVLLAAAAGAELLVVGTRGHGGFTGLLLGSVSEHLVAHAPCAVVVVRGRRK